MSQIAESDHRMSSPVDAISRRQFFAMASGAMLLGVSSCCVYLGGGAFEAGGNGDGCGDGEAMAK
jgi:hypothetical protein